MAKTTQFCVGLENEPGMLGKLCKSLRCADVNIEALCVSDDADCVWVNLVVDAADVAERVLAENGYRFVSEDVLAVEIINQPGELERIAAGLAEADINISYVYGAGVPGSPCKLILSVSDIDSAARVLRSNSQRLG